MGWGGFQIQRTALSKESSGELEGLFHRVTKLGLWKELRKGVGPSTVLHADFLEE